MYRFGGTERKNSSSLRPNLPAGTCKPKYLFLLFDICSFFILHFCARAIAIATHDLTSDKYLQVSLPRNLV